MSETSIESEYKSLSEIDHILHRPNMYIGNPANSIKSGTLLYKPSSNEILLFDFVESNDAMLKLVDEVLSNSTDEFRKDNPKFRVTKIDVEVSVNGTIKITDNGGIPVVFHNDAQCLLPEMLFGRLRSGGNYGDIGDEKGGTKKRRGAGLNGLGSKLTNIFAKEFSVITADGAKSGEFFWSNNMKELKTPITKNTKKHFTQTEFTLDLKRFGVTKLSLDMIRLLCKRIIDSSASNHGLEVSFKTDYTTEKGDSGMFDKVWKFNNLQEFIKLHTNEEIVIYSTKVKHHQQICVTKHLGFSAQGYVNGVPCSSGTHIKALQKQINTRLLKILKEDHNITLLTAKDCENNYTLFCSVNIDNPNYDSQTKDELVTEIHGTQLRISEELFETINTSSIIESLKTYYEIKYLVEEKKNINKLNKTLKGAKSEKLIKCVSKDVTKNELFLFEGTSAIGGFKTNRDVQHQSAYELRGKVTNVWGKSPDQAMLNKELREIIIASNLQFNNPKHNLKHCSFSKYIISTDRDFDGTHISALIFCFFAVFFPELVKDGRMYGLISPIIITKNKKTKEEVLFYSIKDFEKDRKLYENSRYTIKYIKGLGGLEGHHYKELIQNKKLLHFTSDKQILKHLNVWFGDDSQLRKVLLAEGLNMVTEE